MNKIIDLVIGLDNNDKKTKKSSRMSVRAVVEKEGKYLMIQSFRGDLIFPGGGVEEGESKEDAVVRELLEETGYTAIGQPFYLGTTLTRRMDRFVKYRIYESVLEFFKCDVDEVQGEQQLTRYEKELGLEPVWKSAEEIIEHNYSNTKRLGETDVWADMVEQVLRILTKEAKG